VVGETLKSNFESKINGFYQINHTFLRDKRGSFNTWFSIDIGSGMHTAFQTKQANTSTSYRGVIRGIHFSDKSHVQHKIVTCTDGEIMDYAVDLRKESKTFKEFDGVILSGTKANSVFIESGIGHAFEVLSKQATIVYLLSEVWKPDLEYTLNVFDRELSIPWITKRPLLSNKDKYAQYLAEHNNI
jgi:dTDP-4-dehydrorhamnose 3,5-epimerase